MEQTDFLPLQFFKGVIQKSFNIVRGIGVTAAQPEVSNHLALRHKSHLLVMTFREVIFVPPSPKLNT